MGWWCYRWIILYLGGATNSETSSLRITEIESIILMSTLNLQATDSDELLKHPLMQMLMVLLKKKNHIYILWDNMIEICT